MFELRIGAPVVEAAPPGDTSLEWFRLFVALIGHLAWPVAVVVMLLVFRKQLFLLVKRLRGFTGPGVSATFADELEKARAVAETTPTEEVGQPPPSLEEDDPFLSLAKQFPEAAVLNAYKELDRFFSEILDNSPVSPAMAMTVLRKMGGISDEISNLYQRLRATRNAAVHSSKPITAGEAIEYRALVNKLIDALRPFADDLKFAVKDMEPQLQAERERIRKRSQAIRATASGPPDRS